MKKILLTILFLILLFIGLFLGLYLLEFRTQLPGRAAPLPQLSLENSYLFASPLVAKTNGEKITISAFVLSDQGLGLAGQRVILFSNPTLTIKSVQEQTDSRGLAVFEITSITEGHFVLWAEVAGQGRIKQQVEVTFQL